MAGLRAKIKDGPADTMREHVEHFLHTLEDRELADSLTLQRLPDAEALKEVLDAVERAKLGQKKTDGGSKFRQKAPPVSQPKPAAASRAVRAVRVAMADSSSSESESDTGGDGDLRQVYLASAAAPVDTVDNQDRIPSDSHEDRTREGKRLNDLAHVEPIVEKQRAGHCSHCGSLKHTDLGCCKRLTCQKRGKRGHPLDRCRFVCRGCGDLHDVGNCPMEEFYNLIRIGKPLSLYEVEWLTSLIRHTCWGHRKPQRVSCCRWTGGRTSWWIW